MFSKEMMSVNDWLVFFLLMLIPGLNIIIFMILIFSPKTGQSLKNHLYAMIVPIFILVVIYIVVSINMGEIWYFFN